MQRQENACKCPGILCHTSCAHNTSPRHLDNFPSKLRHVGRAALVCRIPGAGDLHDFQWKPFSCRAAAENKSAPTSCLSLLYHKDHEVFPTLWVGVWSFSPFCWIQVTSLFQNPDKQMQPTALILLRQQDSGSSRCPRTLPDGIRLSQPSPLRLQPAYAWQRSWGAATPQPKAERA